jgi:hypothetical protein
VGAGKVGRTAVLTPDLDNDRRVLMHPDHFALPVVRSELGHEEADDCWPGEEGGVVEGNDDGEDSATADVSIYPLRLHGEPSRGSRCVADRPPHEAGVTPTVTRTALN